MPRDPQPRITPLMPPEWDEEILDALGAFPGGLKFVLTGWEESETPARGTNMLGSLAHYPALTKGFLTFNNQVATDSTLTTRERELMILRTGWLRDCEYEFVMHVVLGLRAGLTEEEIERVKQGPDATGWSEQDADLLRVVDELDTDSRISEATWQRLTTRYDHRQIMDMVFLVGCYFTVAMAGNSFGFPVEPGVESLIEDFRASKAAAASD